MNQNYMTSEEIGKIFSTDILNQSDISPRSTDPLYIQGWIDKAETALKISAVRGISAKEYCHIVDILKDHYVTIEMISEWRDSVQQIQRKAADTKALARYAVMQLCEFGACTGFIEDCIGKAYAICSNEIKSWISETLPGGEKQRMDIVRQRLYRQHIETPDNSPHDDNSICEMFGLSIPELYRSIANAEAAFQRTLLEDSDTNEIKKIALQMINESYCLEYIMDIVSGSSVSDETTDEWISDAYNGHERILIDIYEKIMHICSDSIRSETRFLPDLYVMQYGISRNTVFKLEFKALKQFLLSSRVHLSADDMIYDIARMKRIGVTDAELQEYYNISPEALRLIATEDELDVCFTECLEAAEDFMKNGADVLMTRRMLREHYRITDEIIIELLNKLGNQGSEANEKDSLFIKW